MKTSHRESETGHTAAILEEIPAMFCNGLRCLLKLKIAGKTLITSQRVAGPLHNDFNKDAYETLRLLHGEVFYFWIIILHHKDR